jgi:hypothetical protein
VPEPNHQPSAAEIAAAEIAADKILTLLKPPADQREPIRAKVLMHIGKLQGHERWNALGYRLPPGRLKVWLDDYLKVLRQAARQQRMFVPLRLSTGKEYEYGAQLDFRDQLDAQIDHVRTFRDSIKVNRADRPVDLTAEGAVQCALSYLCPQWYRKPIEQWPPVTAGKPWHQLSKLLYEAASGRSDSDKVLNYMRKLKDMRKKGKVLDVIGGLGLVEG